MVSRDPLGLKGKPPVPGPIKDVGWAFFAIWCTSCALGMLGVEAICACYTEGTQDWSDCICSELEANAPLKHACNACFLGIPNAGAAILDKYGVDISASTLLGCSKKCE